MGPGLSAKSRAPNLHLKVILGHRHNITSLLYSWGTIPMSYFSDQNYGATVKKHFGTLNSKLGPCSKNITFVIKRSAVPGVNHRNPIEVDTASSTEINS